MTVRLIRFDPEITAYGPTGPLRYRTILDLLDEWPAGSYCAIGLRAHLQAIIRHIQNAARNCEISAGRRPGRYLRVGHHHFVDAEAHGIDTPAQFEEISRFADEHLAGLRSTPSSTFLAGWEERYKTHEPRAPHWLGNTLYEAECHGVVQAYRYGDLGHCTVMDRRAAYVAGACADLPARFIGSYPRVRRSSALSFVDCEVVVPREYRPKIPVRAGRIYYPTGTVRAILPSVILDRLSSQGYRIFPRVYHLFERGQVLSAFAEYLFTLRESPCFAGIRTWIKKGLVAMIGALGRSPVRQSWLVTPTDVQARTAEYRPATWFPHLPYWIRAIVRQRIIEDADRFDAASVDTDAILTGTPPAETPGLGGWRVQDQGECLVAGARAYWCGKARLSGCQLPMDTPQQFADALGVADRIHLTTEKWAGILPQGIVRAGFISSERRTLPGGDTAPWTAADVYDGAPRNHAGLARRVRLASIKRALDLGT